MMEWRKLSKTAVAALRAAAHSRYFKYAGLLAWLIVVLDIRTRHPNEPVVRVTLMIIGGLFVIFLINDILLERIRMWRQRRSSARQ